MKVKIYFLWFVNLLSSLYSSVIVFFGYKYDTSVIPKGQYCYTADTEKIRDMKDNIFYTKPCVYYKCIGRRYNGCKFLGIITDDLEFDDQCKMCNKNYD